MSQQVMLMSYLTNSVIYTSIDNSILRRCSFDDLGIDLDIFDRIEILETYLKHSERTAIMGSSSGFHHADHTNYASILSKEETLEQLLLSYEALSEDQTNWVCNLSNASSLLWHAYKSLGVNVNWAGFYVTFDSEKDTLLLGPFQGKVACQKIQFGKGVCGTAASTKETQVVRDVNEYPGHIACDGETKSEIVVPIISNDGNTLAVIDLDCLDYKGFDEVDKEFLERLGKLINKSCIFK